MMTKSVSFTLIIFLLFSFSSYGQNESWRSLTLKGMKAYRAGNYSLAIKIFEKAKVQAGKEFGKTHPNYALSLSNLAALYEAKGNYSKAEPLYLEAFKIREKSLGKNHPDYATSLNNLAGLYTSQGRYTQAEPLYLEALQIREKALGKNHPDYATSLGNLAALYFSQGNYTKAEPLLLEALKVNEKVLGKNHPDYATSLNNLAELYKTQGKYIKAEPLYLETLKTREQVLGKSHPKYATSLNNLAGLYDIQGKYAKAEPLYLEALQIREKALGKNHPDYATSLGNLAALYFSQGNYSKAEPLYLEALQIREKVLGKKHPLYATSLNNLASLYESQGRYTQAKPLYLEALKIREKVLGKNNPSYCLSLNNLAAFYESQGRYTQAEPLLVKAKTIYVKVLGKNHPDYASSLGNLAALYFSQGNYSKAEPLYLEALKIREKILGKNHPDYALSLGNLAVSYEAQSNYAKAEPLYLEDLKITAKVLGKSHPKYATSLNNLAYLYNSQGWHTQAKPLYLEVLKIREQVLGKSHPNYALSLNNLAILYEAEGNYSKAGLLYLEAVKNVLKNNAKNTTLLSEKEKKLFYQANEAYFGNFTGFVVDYIQKAKTDQTLKSPKKLIKVLQNLTLTTKAQLLDSKKNLLNAIAEKAQKDEKLKNTYEEYTDLKTFTSKVINLSLADQKKREINIKKNIDRINELEKQLYAAIGEEQQQSSLVNFSLLQKKLDKVEASIDINRVRVVDKKSQRILTNYIALITTQSTKDAPYPLILENGKELEIKYLKAYKNSILKKEVDKTSYQQFFAPIAKYLKRQGIKKVYLSPDGAYNSINLNTLKNSETGKYIEEEFDIQVVTTLRDVVLKKNGSKQKKRSNSGLAVTMGRPDYTLKLDELSKLEKALKQDKKLDRNDDYNPFKSEKIIAQVKKSNWPDLPETEAEVKAIAEVLKKYGKGKGIKTQLDLRKDVHELAIKSIERPKILHIATHGFFVPNEEKKEEEKSNKPTPKIENISFDNRSGSATFKIISEEPMLRSGIALAGTSSYEKAKEKPADIEDGILTAYEASQMDLRGTELVVLSACETGLGDVQNGEGVYGLQRAFIVAGAQNVILSLWKVDDEATKLLMTKFYEEWIGKGKSKRVAFRAAQGYLRNLDKKYQHPYYWGAFQLIGVE